MEPLATYTERLPQVTRVFRLYPDKVVVDAHWRIKGRFQTTIPLDNLRPQRKEHFVRNKLFKTAGLITAVGVVLVAWTVYPTFHWPPTTPTIVGAAIALVGLLMLAFTYQRILFVHFETREGKPALDIARAGPDRRDFEKFISLIQKRIRSA